MFGTSTCGRLIGVGVILAAGLAASCSRDNTSEPPMPRMQPAVSGERDTNQESKPHTTQAGTESSDDATTLILKGKKCFEAEDFQGALTYYRAALALREKQLDSDASQGACHYLVGVALYNLGRYDEAIAAQKKSLAIFGKLPGSEEKRNVCRRVIALAESKIALQQQDAQREFRAKLCPEATEQVRLGEELLGAGDYAGALAKFRAGLMLWERVPNSERGRAGCHQNMGVTLCALGRYREAGEEHQRALAIYSTLPGMGRKQAECHANIALVMARLEQHEEALTEYRNALNTFSKLPGTEGEQTVCRLRICEGLVRLGRNSEGIREVVRLLAKYSSVSGTENEQQTCLLLLDSLATESTRTEAAIGHKAMEQVVVSLSSEQARSLQEARRLFCRAVALSKAGLHPEATALWPVALKAFQAIPGSEGYQGMIHAGMAEALVLAGRYSESLQEVKTAQELLGNIPGNELVMAAVQATFATALSGIGQHQEAVELMNSAMRMYQQLPGTELRQAILWSNLGVVLHNAGDYQEALQAKLNALAIFTKLRVGQARLAACYMNLGATLVPLGHFEEAIAAQRTAIRLVANTSNGELIQARCHGNIGLALSYLGRSEEAVREAESASSLFRKSANTTREQATCHRNAGIAMAEVDAYEDAVAAQQAALELLRKLPDTALEQASCHLNMGIALHRAGRFDDAIEEFLACRSLCEDHPGRTELHGKCLTCLSLVMSSLGRGSEAMLLLAGPSARIQGWWVEEARAKAAEAAAEATGKNYWLGMAMQGRLNAIMLGEEHREQIGSSEYRMSWFEDKAHLYEDLAAVLLRLEREKVDLVGPLPVIIEKGGIGPSLTEAALHFVDRGKGRTLLELISARGLQTGDPQVSQLVAESRKLGSEINVILKHRGSAAQPGQDQDFEDMTRQIERKQARQRQIEAALRQTAAGAFMQPDMIKPTELCKTLAPGEACLEYAACEKELLIFLVTGKGVKAFRVEIDRHVPRSLRERGRPSYQKLLTAYRQTPDRPQVLGLEGLVWFQREWMDNWQKRTLTEAEHVATSRVLGDVLLPAELRRVLAVEKVKHLVIVPSRVLALTSFATLVMGPRQGPTVPKTLSECRFLVSEFSVSYVQALSLLNPIRKRALEKRRIRRVEGELLAIADPIHDDSDPRSARVPPGSKAVSERTEPRGVDIVVRDLVRNVGIAPDASQRLQWPRLPETRREAETAAREFGACNVYDEPMTRLPEEPTTTNAICVGYSANRLLAMSDDMCRYRNILFGVHGHCDMSNPWLSCLMLTDLSAEPGKRQPVPLTMTDVFGMNLQAEIVTLAACRTAAGRMRAGEGVVGFQLAFIFAGADSVVLTQWEVPSAVERGPEGEKVYPTTDVIVRFYRHLREEKLSRAEALRQAQITVLGQGGEFANPFYWGAWQLFGEWRHSPRDR